MKKQLLLLLTIEAIMTSMSMNAQVFQMVGSDHGLSIEDVHLVEAGKAWGSIDGAVDISNAFATDHSIYDCKTHDYIKVLIDGNEILTSGGVRGNDNPHDEDGGNPALTLKTPVSGSVIQLDAKKNGFVYIVARLSTNKQYMVFEDGSAMGYKIAMEVDDNRIPSSVLNLEIKGEGEYNYIPEGRQVQWVIREYLNDAEAATAGNGLGVLYFPVVKGRKYLAHATGSKINWCGIYFSEMEPFSIKVVKESGAELYLTENIIEKDGIFYGLSSPYTVGLYSLNNEVENVNIPQTIIHNDKTYYVTSISSSAFRGCSFLTSITIPNSVTSIGDNAFYGCSSLESITIPNSVTTIGSSAFSGCSGLTAVNIPNSITSISESAFRGCSSLTSVTIGNGVTSIGKKAFEDCSSLTAITITSSAISINSSAFSGCSELKTIYYNCKEIGDVIPSAIRGNITNIIIGDEVTSISNNAFSGFSGLTSVTIPNSVTSIGNGAFEGCSCLTSVTITSSEISINSSAFSGCSELKTIYYDCKEIGNVIPSAIKGNITNVILGNEVTSIGSYAFSGFSGLTSVNIPNSVTSIGDDAFSGCSGLTSINIPNGVTSIGNYAFRGCSGLTSITIPNSVTSIGGSAFSGCSGLTSVTIGNSVTSIGGSAFSGCSGLTSVTIGNSVTSIGGSAFSGCSGLTSVTIGNSVTSIGNSAFYYCSGLTSITIPNSVTSIGDHAFYGCSGLTSVTIPNSVTSIGSEAFYGCSSLTTVTIPNSVTSIGQSAFNGCTGLTSVTIGNNVTSIGDYAFQGCSGLTSVTIPNSVTSIGNSAFRDCSGLTAVTIPNSVTSIGGNAFYGCSGLTTITIPNSVTSIEKYAFDGCDNLLTVNSEILEPFNCPNAFSTNTQRKGTLIVPAGTMDLYTRFDGWREFLKIEEAGRTYQLSFVVNNILLSSQDTETGATITPPTRDNEGNTISWYTYPETMPAYNLVVYGMTSQPVAPTKYTITYVVDGQTYRSVTVDEGATVSKEKAPYKEGYTFNGWQNEPSTMPANNVTVSGSFSINTYRLAFIVENKELSKQDVTYGSAITTPSKDSEGYTISWYSHPATMPAYNLVVYGMVEPAPETFVWLTVKDGQGTTKMKVKQGAEQTLTISPEEGWKLLSVTMDGTDVTDQVKDGASFTTPAINSDATIIIVYEQDTPSGVRTTRSQADIKVVSDGVVISNAEPQSRCIIYGSDGQQVVNTVINDGTRKIALQQGQVYILTINGRTLKFAL